MTRVVMSLVSAAVAVAVATALTISVFAPSVGSAQGKQYTASQLRSCSQKFGGDCVNNIWTVYEVSDRRDKYAVGGALVAATLLAAAAIASRSNQRPHV